MVKQYGKSKLKTMSLEKEYEELGREIHELFTKAKYKGIADKIILRAKIMAIEETAKEHGCKCYPDGQLIGCDAGDYCYHNNIDPLGRIYEKSQY